MRRGALLLELLISLVILVGAGLAVLAMLAQGVRSAREAGEQLRAIDYALSALAKIEAGIETPESLDGEIPVWVDEEATTGAAFDESIPEPSGWRLEIDSSRAGHADLTVVTVRAVRERATGEISARFTASEFVRFSSTDPADENPENAVLRGLEP